MHAACAHEKKRTFPATDGSVHLTHALPVLQEKRHILKQELSCNTRRSSRLSYIGRTKVLTPQSTPTQHISKNTSIPRKSFRSSKSTAAKKGCRTRLLCIYDDTRVHGVIPVSALTRSCGCWYDAPPTLDQTNERSNSRKSAYHHTLTHT